MASPVPVLADKRFSWLLDKSFDKYTQFGEDGLIGAVLDRIGEKNKWCFEVGAADGLFYSNTKLLRDQGWSAVLIEADDDKFCKLQKYEGGNVHCIHETITPTSLDKILTECGAPADLDVGVIDIDGQDFHIWEGLQDFLPRIMLVEFGPSTNLRDFIPQLGGEGQAGRDAISDLGRKKGYTPVCHTQVNTLFVLEQ